MNRFEEICGACYQDVFRYACALCRDRTLAEELTQEAFCKAFSAFRTFRGQCSPYTWLCGIVKNAYFEHCRRQKRIAPLEQVPEPSTQESGETRFLSDESLLSMHRALHGLEEPFKEVFTLRVFGDLSHAQIAELFGKSENWSRVVYHRARARLRQIIEEEES